MKSKKLLLALIIAVFCSATATAQNYSVFKWINIKQVEITAYTLNVRTGPGTNYPIINRVKRGQIVDVLGALKGWYVIHLPNDSVGVISSKYTRAYRYHNPPEQKQPAPKPPTTQPPKEPEETPSTALTKQEQEMFNLINEARKKQGLSPYKLNPEVIKVARLKAKDMAQNQYFSHNSPTYGSPFEMLKKFGISYRTAGENIAGNYTVQGAHNALMNSPGHKANILSSQFDEIGIGIVPDKRYGYVFVQMFIKQ